MEAETILVVDDNKEIVYSISELLKYEGYQVIKAYDGMEALEALEKENIPMAEAEVTMIPQTWVELTDEAAVRSLQKTLDLLEDDDDVQAVYHNWDE